MKRIIFINLMILLSSLLFAQNVERLVRTSEMNNVKFTFSDDPYYENCDGSDSPHPSEFYVDEVSDKIVLTNSSLRKSFAVIGNKIQEEKYEYYFFYDGYYKFPGFILSSNGRFVQIDSLYKNFVNSYESIYEGPSFILKKDNGYIILGVDQYGKPVAIDTFGKKYNSLEAMEYLKEYDPEKYEKSSARAKELGLKGKFDLYEVLIWGDAYFDRIENLVTFWSKRDWLYPERRYKVCYDLNGYGYQFGFRQNTENTKMVCVNPDGDWEYEPIALKQYSDILKRQTESSYYYGYWIVMPTGNAYYFITDSTETEVFRIRNTWDSSNLYALAINGYTEDFYGDYVKEVLPKMSKADLRLLRNTVFALYGVHFKSEDLAKYFDKQVWYTDEGKSSGEVTLPENRQKLVEMILKLEK